MSSNNDNNSSKRSTEHANTGDGGEKNQDNLELLKSDLPSEIFKSIPQDKLEDIIDQNLDSNSTDHEILKLVFSQYESRHISGPLPPPEMLEGYNNIVPGAAEKIISNMLAESLHRRDRETHALTQAIDTAKKGQNQGFAIALLAILATTCILIISIFQKSTGGLITGTIFSGASLANLVGRLIDGKSGKNTLLPKSDAYKKDDEISE